jgi:hypothetical protein
MRSFLALLPFVVCSSIAYSQSSTEPIRVCVAALENDSAHLVSTTWEQDQLVRALERLNKSKDVTKGKIARIDPIALKSTSGADSDVRNKDCRFVLYTKLTEVQHPNEVALPRPSAAEVARVDVGDPRAYPPDYNNATLTYRVMRDGRQEDWTSGILSESGAEDDQMLVSQLMDQVARRVAKELREPHPSSPE